MKGSEVLRTSSPENAEHPGIRGCVKPGKDEKKDMGHFQMQFLCFTKTLFDFEGQIF